MSLSPGCLVCVPKRRLRPRSAAGALPSDSSDVVGRLEFVGMADREVAGRTVAVFLLRHPDLEAELFTLRAPTADAGFSTTDRPPDPPAHNESSSEDDADFEEEDEEEEEDADVDYDDDDDGGPFVDAPPVHASTAAQYEDWAHTPADLAPDRSTRAPQLHITGIAGGFFSPARMFLFFFPEASLDRIVLATNARDSTVKLTQEELLCWLGLVLIASDFLGPQETLWLPTREKYCPRPPLGDAMSRRRFEAIASALRLTDSPRPAYRDRFFDLRGIIEDFNEHMAGLYSPSGTVCLDAGSTFDDRQFAPRMPSSVDAAYATMCDAATCIIFRIELMERRGRPPQLGKPKYEEQFHSKATGLMMRMTETIRGTGIVVVMGSAFCDVGALAALQKEGLYACTVAKKHATTSWPRHVPGDDVRSYMEDKPAGELHGRRATLGGMPFNLFAVNHRRYTFIALATYGSTRLEPVPCKLRTADGLVLTYKRNEAIGDYYRARQAVGNHIRCHQGQRVSLATSCDGEYRANGHLGFLVNVALVNAVMAYNHFVASSSSGPKRQSFDDFKARVAVELVEAWEGRARDTAEALGKRPKRADDDAAPVVEHGLEKIPPFEGAVPGKRTATKYQQVHCKGGGCSKKVRTYCRCDRSVVLCQSCFAAHLIRVARK